MIVFIGRMIFLTGKALLVINPCSGKGMAKRVLLDIVTRLNDGGCTVTVLPTKKGSATIDTIAAETAHYDMVIACGGDGTLNMVAEGVTASGTKTPIGYIPLGTTNDFASSLGIPSDIGKAVEAILAGSPHPHDLGCFGEKHFTYIACCGAFTETSYSTPQTLKNIFGHAAYVLNVVPLLADIHPMEITAETDEGTLDGKFIFCALANTTTAAGFIKLDGKDVDFADGKFELILIRFPKDLPEGNRVAAKLIKGDMNDPLIEIHHTSFVRFRSEKPVGWSLDGENGGKHDSVLLSVEKNAAFILK